MNPLIQAKNLEYKLAQARTDLEIFLEPFLYKYIEFMDEINPRYHDSHDKEVDTFVEIDGEAFLFEGDEYYEYGENITPSVSLPFAFVQDPEVFMDNLRESTARAAAKYAKDNEDRAKARVDLLRRQLETAERSLATANAQGDSIKAVANRNLLDKAGL